MGDGVNIAARLEEASREPGAICLSEDATTGRSRGGSISRSAISARLQLKNIKMPTLVRVYSLEVGKPAQARPTKPATPEQRSRFMLLAAGIVALVVITAGIWLAVRRGEEV